MNKTGIAILSTCLMVSVGGAFAQDAAKKAEEQKNSAEMMKPPTNAPERTMSPAGQAAPVSEDDRKAEEARKRTEMMKPETSTPAGSADKAPTATPTSEADRKVEEERQKTEMMKPK